MCAHSKDKIGSKIIWNIFIVFDILSLILILVICIADTQNNLPISKMIILPFVWALPFVFVFWMREWFVVFLNKVSKYAFPCALILYGSTLFWICTREQFEFVHDQQMVYQGALYMAGLAEEINWEYFARCNNNVIPMLVLAQMLKMGHMIGLDAPYYLAIGLNVLQVIIVLVCLFFVLKRKTKYGILMAWLGSGMLAISIPVIGQTMSVYTDSMSFCFSMLAVCMWIKCEERWLEEGLNTSRLVIWLFLVGSLMGIAVSIKITSAISIIAFLLYGFLNRNDDKKPGVKKLLKLLYWGIVPVVMICVFLLLNWYTTTLPCEAYRDSYGTPKVSYWIGIGIKGNGGYVDNQEYSYMLNTIYGMEQKEAWSREYIVENIGEFVNPEHIISKLRYNFANGRLGAGDFMLMGQSQSFLAECMSSEGVFYWRYSMLNTSYMYFIYWCILIHAINTLGVKRKMERIDAISLISVFGIMLYVMLFEANNRQLYNHLPWLILAAVLGIYKMFLFLDRICVNNAAEKVKRETSVYNQS